MFTDDDAPPSGADEGLALLEAELAALTSNLADLQAALLELQQAMQLQCALELGAPRAGDHAVRWN